MPKGLRAIFLDAPHLNELGNIRLQSPTGFSTGGTDLTDRTEVKVILASGRSKVEAVDGLTFVLLHEMGHISNGHENAAAFASSFEAEQGKPSRTTTWGSNALKERELSADRWVLKTIRDARLAPAGSPRRETAERFVTTLKILRLYLSTQAEVWRRGGQEGLFSRLSFGDPKRTHPNLEYRLTLILYALQPTPANRSTVLRFLDQRRQKWSLTRSTLSPELREKLDEKLRVELEQDLEVLNKILGIESRNEN